jgi:hypothetical protein
MNLRRFNPAGMQAFRYFLAASRRDPSMPVPQQLLADDTATEVLRPTLEVVGQTFATRGDAAKYLVPLLAALPEQEVANDAGLWTWLTLFFFDQVAPARAGNRRIKNDYTYVFEPKNPRHFYRHLLFIAWRVAIVAPTSNRLFLNSPLASLDKVTSEVMKRLFLTRIPCIFEVLDRLYWDEDRQRPRTGIVSPETVKPGDLIHRFPLRIRQLEMTYDLLSLNADQLLDLLGDEFSPPLPAAAAES